MLLLARVAASFFIIYVFLLLFDEDDGVGGDAFLAAREAKALGGSGLDGYIVDIAADNAGHRLLHLRDMGIHLRTLGTDGGVDVDQMIAFGGNKVDGLAEENLAVDAVGLGSGIRKVVANVAHIGGTEEGVADGVQQHVSIAVTQQSLTMFYLDAAHPQVAAFYQLMDVEAHSYSDTHIT